MNSPEDHFEIVHLSFHLQVERLKIPGHSAFRVIFSDGRKPLVLARASNADAVKFWTSIPEGRQKEADEIGQLIEYHINK